MTKHETGQTVVFIFFDPEKDLVLLEKRPPSSSFASHLIFPGGAIEDDELEDFEGALIREVREELGVVPLKFEPVETKEYIYGETGKLLRPYLIKKWRGTLPERVLDKGNAVVWEEVDLTATSPLLSVRKITTALKSHLGLED